MMYNVSYATGSRADYGIVRNYLKLLDKDKEIDFSVLATGSHLDSSFGNSLDIIKGDHFKIDFQVPVDLSSLNNDSITYSMGYLLDRFGRYFSHNKPDLLILLGDRYEVFSIAIAAAMNGIKILHLHGGERTDGNYDEFIRHSITKMSLFHFTSTEEYRKRVIQLGESPERVFYLGALGAENCRLYDYNLVIPEVKSIKGTKYFVISFHPETLSGSNVIEQTNELLLALKSIPEEYQMVFIGTNADTGADRIRAMVKDFVANRDCLYFENLDPASYFELIKNSIALVGNSSAGIIEAPSLGTYTINIGDRQRGRVYANSVLHSKCKKEQIINCCEFVINHPIDCKINNPYYKKDTAVNYYNKTKELLSVNIENTVKSFFDVEYSY